MLFFKFIKLNIGGATSCSNSSMPAVLLLIRDLHTKPRITPKMSAFCVLDGQSVRLRECEETVCYIENLFFQRRLNVVEARDHTVII